MKYEKDPSHIWMGMWLIFPAYNKSNPIMMTGFGILINYSVCGFTPS
jgi:hypothetical protein